MLLKNVRGDILPAILNTTSPLLVKWVHICYLKTNVKEKKTVMDENYVEKKNLSR